MSNHDDVVHLKLTHVCQYINLQIQIKTKNKAHTLRLSISDREGGRESVFGLTVGMNSPSGKGESAPCCCRTWVWTNHSPLSRCLHCLTPYIGITAVIWTGDIAGPPPLHMEENK